MIEGINKTYRKFLEKQNFCKIFVRGQDTKRDGKILNYSNYFFKFYNF